MLVRFQRYPVFNQRFDDFTSVERQVNDLFRDYFTEGGASLARTSPAIDIADYDNETVVVAELPGVKKEDVKVSFEKGLLTISGERKAPSLPEKAAWVRNEITTGQFTRAFALPHDVEAEKISAEMANGVLRIVVPKAEAARPREIRIV